MGNLKVVEGVIQETLIRSVTRESLIEEQGRLIEERDRALYEVKRIDAELNSVGMKIQMIDDAKAVTK